jgi:hypothetical protein
MRLAVEEFRREFRLAHLDPLEKLPVISCKELFFRQKTGPKRRSAHRPDRRFENFIHELHPEIHDGFFLASLDLILQKPP